MCIISTRECSFCFLCAPCLGNIEIVSGIRLVYFNLKYTTINCNWSISGDYTKGNPRGFGLWAHGPTPAGSKYTRLVDADIDKKNRKITVWTKKLQESVLHL